MRAFLDVHAALIFRLARHMVREQGGALGPEDVAHEVIVGLLKMHEAGTFDPARLENPEAYLRVVVRNAAHRARRRRAIVERIGNSGDIGEALEEAAPLDAEPVPSPEDLTRRAQDARRMLDALKRALRPRDALALTLLVEEGLDIEDVAVKLGTTPNNVYQMRHRIVTAAREILGKDDSAEALDSVRGSP